MNREITEPFIVASRGRNPENPSDRTTGSPTVQRLEPNRQGICNTLTTVQKDNYVIEPSFINGDICKTVRAGGHGSTDRHSWDMVECNTSLRIRKLTPLECWRLMGFDDDDFYKAEKVCSNTQLYKQAGNSIVVDVLEYLFKEIMEVLEVKKVEDKVVVFECEGLINLAKLKEKEPELYEELLADYPCEKATYVFKVVS